jgi:uncharacterized OB-fold protein
VRAMSTEDATSAGGSARDADAPSIFARYPDAPIDLDNRAFYEGLLVRELRLNRCGRCRTWHHPPRPICPQCWSRDVLATPVSGRGSVYLSTLLRHGPVSDYPHPVVTVEFDDQRDARFTSTMLGRWDSAVPIGTRVALAWVERGGAPFPVFQATDER